MNPRAVFLRILSVGSAAAALVLPLLLAHCSSTISNPAVDADGGTPGGPGTTGGPSGTDGGGSGGDPGAPDAHGGDPGDPDAGPTGDDHQGAVSIVESGGTEQESAIFRDIPPVNRCTIRETTDCRVIVCPAGDGVTQSRDVSAGVTTLSGGTGQPIQLTQEQGAVQATPPWVAGNTIAIAASGAAVPAFSTTLLYPSNITVTGPAPSVPEYTVVLDRAAGVQFTWTSATPAYGGVIAAVTQMQPTQTVSVSCLFPQSAGAGTMPGDIMTELEPGYTENTKVEAHPASRNVVHAGAYRIESTVLRFNAYYVALGIVM